MVIQCALHIKKSKLKVESCKLKYTIIHKQQQQKNDNKWSADSKQKVGFCAPASSPFGLLYQNFLSFFPPTALSDFEQLGLGLLC